MVLDPERSDLSLNWKRAFLPLGPGHYPSFCLGDCQDSRTKSHLERKLWTAASLLGGVLLQLRFLETFPAKTTITPRNNKTSVLTKIVNYCSSYHHELSQNFVVFHQFCKTDQSSTDTPSKTVCSHIFLNFSNIPISGYFH